MKNKLVVYFHGLGSNSKTDKVSLLRKGLRNARVVAFDASVSPAKAIADVSDKIDMSLLDNMHADETVVFVGTSLGAWLAATLAKKYNVKAVLINPCRDPKNTLPTLGVEKDISDQYEHMPVLKNAKYFLADADEVINHRAAFYAGLDVTWVKGADHRFNGDEFNLVINYINKL